MSELKITFVDSGRDVLTKQAAGVDDGYFEATASHSLGQLVEGSEDDLEKMISLIAKTAKSIKEKMPDKTKVTAKMSLSLGTGLDIKIYRANAGGTITFNLEIEK